MAALLSAATLSAGPSKIGAAVVAKLRCAVDDGCQRHRRSLREDAARVLGIGTIVEKR